LRLDRSQRQRYKWHRVACARACAAADEVLFLCLCVVRAVRAHNDVINTRRHDAQRTHDVTEQGARRRQAHLRRHSVVACMLCSSCK